MSWTHALADRVRRGEPLPLPLHWMLSAATPVTRLGMWSRSLRAPVKLDAHVISVGNITAGGTGKTPAVIAELDTLSGDNDATVAVLTRGYGSAQAGAPLVSSEVPDDRRTELLGDEPALILKKHPEVLVVKCRDRIAGAESAIHDHACNVLVLDDGFQYVQLHRDVNKLLVDATNPFGNGYLIPRGILREPLSAIARATEVVLTRCDQAPDLDAIESTIRRYTDAPIVRTVHRPTGFTHLSTGESLALTELRDNDVTIASAIGNPEAFRATIEALGIRVVQVLAYPDHARIPPDELPRDRMVIVTEKDAVKLEQPTDNIYALSISLEPWD